jgi:hypothetical protein
MKDEGPDDAWCGLEADDSPHTEWGARNGTELEALLGEEAPPPALWHRVQAQLRRDGIIR